MDTIKELQRAQSNLQLLEGAYNSLLESSEVLAASKQFASQRDMCVSYIGGAINVLVARKLQGYSVAPSYIEYLKQHKENIGSARSHKQVVMRIERAMGFLRGGVRSIKHDVESLEHKVKQHNEQKREQSIVDSICCNLKEGSKTPKAIDDLVVGIEPVNVVVGGEKYRTYYLTHTDVMLIEPLYAPVRFELKLGKPVLQTREIMISTALVDGTFREISLGAMLDDTVRIPDTGAAFYKYQAYYYDLVGDSCSGYVGNKSTDSLHGLLLDVLTSSRFEDAVYYLCNNQLPSKDS